MIIDHDFKVQLGLNNNVVTMKDPVKFLVKPDLTKF